MTRPLPAALLLTLLTTLAACATAPARRGAGADAIHDVAVGVAVGEGYACKASPDKGWRDCTHPEKTDVSFAYLPQSNLLQVWTYFSRDDEGLAAKWRKGSCEPLRDDVDRINANNVIKLVCDEDSFRFELSVWMPENGFVDEDFGALFELFRVVVGESIRGGGFLPSSEGGAEATSAAPSDA